MSAWNRRRGGKPDANQAEVVNGLRSVGASVAIISQVGHGCPDLLVGYRMETHLLEVKDGRKPPSARRLTPLEEAWHRNWHGRRVAVVECLEDALLAVGVTRTHRRDAGFDIGDDGEAADRRPA